MEERIRRALLVTGETVSGLALRLDLPQNVVASAALYGIDPAGRVAKALTGLAEKHQLCPECFDAYVVAEGCKVCHGCGWSVC